MRLLFAILISFPVFASAQGFPTFNGGTAHQGASQVVVVPQPMGIGGRNAAGWTTGYSVVTTTRERPSILGSDFDGDNSVVETVTQVVPNNALGQPMRGGVQPFGERNSAGWTTGYSAVTSTYQRPDLFGSAFGGANAVTETTTQIVPNDALGNPIGGIAPFWP